MNTLKELIKQQTAKSTTVVKKVKPSLDYGDLSNVMTALLAGSTVFAVNLNFKKGSSLDGDKPSMPFFGGSLKRKKDCSNAFAEFIPTSFSIKDNKKVYISSGTSYSLALSAIPSEEKLASLAAYTIEARNSFIKDLIVQSEYDYDAWQALCSESFGSEIKLQFNVPNWNFEFIEAMNDNRDLDLDDPDLIRSMTIYFSVAKEDGASIDLKNTDILKTSGGEVVKGKLVSPAVFACFFSSETFKSARFEGSVSREQIARISSEILEMKSIVGDSNSLSKQVAKQAKKGKFTLESLKNDFESGLQSGHWIVPVENQLMELAASSSFAGWSLLAAKVYFSKLSNQYEDIDYIEEEVSYSKSKEQDITPVSGRFRLV